MEATLPNKIVFDCEVSEKKILTVVQNKLTNKVNAIMRMPIPKDEKAEAIESLIASV